MSALGLGRAAPARPIVPRAILLTALAIGTAALLGAIGGEEPVLAIAAASAFGVGAAIVLRPDLAIPLSIGAIYANVPVVMVRFHGVPDIAAVAVILLLAVPIAEDLIVRRRPVVVPRAAPWIVALALVMLLSAFFSRDTDASLTGVVTFLVEGVLLYGLVVNAVRDPDRLRLTTWTILAAGALVGALSVHQQLTGRFGDDYFGFAQATEAAVRTGVTTLRGDVVQPRLTGPIGEENRYAQVMLMLVPLGIALAAGARTWLVRLAAYGMTALVTAGMVLTLSRGAAVAFAGVMVLAVLLRLLGARVLAFGAVVALAAVLLVPGYAARLGTIEELTAFIDPDRSTTEVGGAVASRATEAGAAALVFADHPLLGVGPDMYRQYYREYATEIGIRVLAAERQAHNLYLGLAAELGLAGLLAFGGVIVTTVGGLLRARRDAVARHPDLAHLAGGYVLAVAAYLMSGMFLHLAFIRYLWLMLALAGAAAWVIARAARETPVEEGRAARAIEPPPSPAGVRRRPRAGRVRTRPSGS